MRPLCVIVIAELFGTSLWFCGAVAGPDLAAEWNLSAAARGGLLAAVQLGFVVGTLGVAASGLADRVSASRVFAAAALAGAALNAAFVLAGGFAEALLLRFAVGVCLAGIYPVGMKLVVGWCPTQAGAALGWLIGALVVGSAVPYLVRGLGENVPWRAAVLAASGLAVVAAGLVATLGDGPNSQPGAKPATGRLAAAAKAPGVRTAAAAYLGHMWELYAFWAVVPGFVQLVLPDENAGTRSLIAFAVIAAGAAGCVVGGRVARRRGHRVVAAAALAGSGFFCFLAPALPHLPAAVAVAALVAWGVLVVADSPQFAALTAAACPPGTVGSALAAQNGVGFLLTVFVVPLSAELFATAGPWVGWAWLPGPLLALWALRPPTAAPPAGYAGGNSDTGRGAA